MNPTQTSKLNRRTPANWLSALMMLVLVLGGASFARAEAMPAGHTVDWNSLYDVCESDWSQYTRRLTDLRDDMESDLQALSKQQYTDLFLQDDPRILFIQTTWPELLRGKDEFWRAHLECSDAHREVRQAFDSPNSTLEIKREAVSALSDCLVTRYTRGRKVPPLDRMLRCYDQHASK